MYTFEMNKIAGAVLFTLLVVLGLGTLADIIFTPHAPEKTAYVVEGVEEVSTPGTAPAEEEPPIGLLLAEASIEDGEKVARKCVSCHTFEKGEPNRVGPNLWNVVGGKKAHLDDFNYSSVMAEAGAEGEVWGYEELFGYLENPRKYMPGNKMAFAGLRKAEDRADMVAYLAAHTENPPAFPVPEPPAAPEAEAPEADAGEAGAAKGVEEAAPAPEGTPAE